MTTHCSLQYDCGDKQINTRIHYLHGMAINVICFVHANNIPGSHGPTLWYTTYKDVNMLQN